MGKVFNAIVGQSGGPTAVINASLAGVIKAACTSEKIGKIYGMRNGIGGMMEERLVDLTELGNDEEALSLLSKTPAAYLGSCRIKLPQDDDAVFEKIFETLEKYDIGYFFYIGGNDSMDTILKLSAYGEKNGKTIRFVGVPKTIDNDLTGTDHTPGYGSAAKYIATMVREISADSLVYDMNSVTIIEVMGRDAGWLTGASVLARYQGLGPDLIYLPETAFDFDKFSKDVETVMSYKKNVIVAISEGVRTKDGTYVCNAASDGTSDAFGHARLGGTARVLEAFIKEKFGCRSRGVELNVPQRCAGHLLSETDVTETFGVGKAAVEAAVDGATGIMLGIQRVSDEPYQTQYAAMDVKQVANQVKSVPRSFINEQENDVTEEFIKYVSPLIIGEIKPEYENGVPKLLVLKKDR